MSEHWQAGGFGLYLHWPFCASKCPYCDFNSHVGSRIDFERWQRAYSSAIGLYAAETSGRVLRSIYLGGGTPSLMPPEMVAAILEEVRSRWRLANDVEITLEANPGSVEAARFAGYRAAGVNRVSLGLQALNDDDLRRLGRLHSTAEALAALEIARNTFDRVSFDLIYARQAQSLADWRAELGRALSFGPSHLSLYQLTIEPETAFGARARAGGLRDLPDEDLSADMYFLTQELCEDAGLPAYEVSNHAKTGQESRHNMIYWQAGDYVGIGPGAHGRMTLGGKRYATESHLSPEDWLSNVAFGGQGEVARFALSAADQAAEYLMMGLRTLLGVDLSRLDALRWNYINDSKINVLSDLDLVIRDHDSLRVTRKGRPVLNGILRELLPD